MKKSLIRFCLLFAVGLAIFDSASAQKKPARKVVKRTTTKKTASTKTKAKVKPSVAATDTVAKAAIVAAATVDTLPIKKVLPSLRPDEAVETSSLRDRTPLPYENLRADDALFRHK